ADKIPERIRRLVYWNAFVPQDGESIADMLPRHHVDLFESSAAERRDGSIVLPFAIWREAFINDADLATAQHTYELLNPHPFKTLTDNFAQQESRRDGNPEILHQLHRGYRAAPPLPLPAPLVGETGPISAHTGSGQP